MKRLIIAAAFVAALVVPAFAQQKAYSAMSDEEKAHQKVADSVDRQYRNAIDNTRNDASAVSVDPWAKMRGAGNSKKH